MKEKKLLNFYEHQQRAHDEYIAHLRECDHRDQDSYLDERDVAFEIDCLEDVFQIKMLDNGIVKIKWESPCQYIGCHWHLYYCRLAIDPNWQEPHELRGYRCL